MALLDPAVRRDRARVDALLARDFVEFGASGRVWTRDSILDLLATEAYVPVPMEDFACAVLGEGVALVTYRARGCLRSSVWVWEDGAWKVRFHQGTPKV
jgi:ribonuclease HI